MDLGTALDVLGVPAGASMVEVRAAYRREIRLAHPDVSGPGPDHPSTGHERTAMLTEAWAVVRAAGTTLPPPPPPSRSPATTAGGDEPLPEAAALSSDTIGVAAPPDETFAVIAEAAGVVGDIAYVDRNLGILEAIVRFEGGPSCSLLITLQGRAWGTEAFCTLESIEADPTPPIRPVMDALLEALTGPGHDDSQPDR